MLTTGCDTNRGRPARSSVGKSEIERTQLEPQSFLVLKENVYISKAASTAGETDFTKLV